MPTRAGALLAALLVSSCQKAPQAAPAAADAAATAAALPSAEPTGAGAPSSAAPATPAPPPAPRLMITLRSTPSGAEVSVDGRPVGKTPQTVAIDDNGKEHEFTFILADYGMERYRTQPLKDGVIHARMRKVPSGADAGPHR